MTGRSCVLLLAALAIALLPSPTAAAAVDGVIVVRGNKLYNANTGERFFIKGVRTDGRMGRKPARH
jgi:TM2 domain-containing membrane protein YozV